MAAQLTNHSPNKYHKHSNLSSPNRSNQTFHPVLSPEDTVGERRGKESTGVTIRGAASQLTLPPGASPLTQGATVMFLLLPDENSPISFCFLPRIKMLVINLKSLLSHPQ